MYETRARNSYTDDEMLFAKLHHQKIDLADAIFVANFNGYNSEGTRNDIEYAKKQGKK